MNRLILLTIIACATVSVAFGRKDKSGIEYQNIRGPFVTNPFGDNWFISAGGGVNTWLRITKVTGETFKGFDKYSYVAQMSVGKWLHPYYGVRINFNYGNVKAGTSLPTGRYTYMRSNGEYMLDFNYWEVGGEIFLHFSNMVGGYKHARFYNAILFAGVGMARSFSTSKTAGEKWDNNEPALGVGIQNTLRLTDGLSLYSEIKAGLMHGNFSLASGGKGRAMIPSITLGMAYKFKDRMFYSKRSAVARALWDATSEYTGRIAVLESELVAARARNSRLQAELEARPEQADSDARAAQVVVKDVPFTIFFPRGQSTLNPFAQLDIYQIAEVIKTNPYKLYTIKGYADKTTGNAQVNRAVSEARVENVRKALVENNGVNPEQIEVEAMGDTVNPFDIAEMNRVVIISSSVSDIRASMY
jgi:outer membrane protein OmpA-like peptidoglycan-associated protein